MLNTHSVYTYSIHYQVNEYNARAINRYSCSPYCLHVAYTAYISNPPKLRMPTIASVAVT